MMAQTRDWKGMQEMSARLLHERTGQDLETWNQRITSEGFMDEQTLRARLTESSTTASRSCQIEAQVSLGKP
jgi:hypothetical protein